MRFSLLIYSLLLAPVAIPVTGYEIPAQASAGPTIEETASWLSSNLVGVQYALQRTTVRLDPKKKTPIEKSRRVFQDKWTIIQARMDHCLLAVTEKHDTETERWSSTDTKTSVVPLNKMQSVELKTIDNSKLESPMGSVETYVPVTYIVILVSADREVVKWTSRSQMTGESATDDQGIRRFFDLGIDDPPLAQRLSKALSHAVDLCRASAKPDPF
jgi:hypothetical protein